MFLNRILVLISFLACIAAFGTNSRLESPQYTVQTIYEFPDYTWIENLAIRSDGRILCTIFNRGEVHLVDPFDKANNNDTLVHRFAEADGNAVSGIAEFSPDVFAVTLCHLYSTTNDSYRPYNCSLWKIEFPFESSGSNHNPNVSKITDLPWSGNGMTLLRTDPPILLLADSNNGRVFMTRIDTGESTVVLTDDTLEFPPNATGPVSVDGIRYRPEDGYLYFTNPSRLLFCRVPISSSTGEATGPYSIIAHGVSGDDFALDACDAAYLATNPDNTVERVILQGNVSTIAGNLNSSIVAGATSAAFGRTRTDKNILYVVTNGGIASPVNGTFVEGGKVLSVTT